MVLVVKCLICQQDITYSQENPYELVQHMRSEHKFEKKSKQSSSKKVDREIEDSFEENSRILNNLIDRSAQTETEYIRLLRMDPDQRFDHSTPRISNESGSYESFRNQTQHDSKRNSDGRNSNQSQLDKSTRQRTSKQQQPETSHARRNAVSHEDVNDERQKLMTDKRRSKKFYKTSIERWRPVGDNKINCPRCQTLSRPTVRTQHQHVTTSSVVSSFLMTCWPLCFSPCYLPEPKYENLYCPVCNYHLGIFDHAKKTVTSNPNLMRE